MDPHKTALILDLVARIPPGQAASYGQIADYVPGATARLVGTVMAGYGARVPWQRVINAHGRVSAHGRAAEQRRRLEAEGVAFDARDRVDWAAVRWAGPNKQWLLDAGHEPEAVFGERFSGPRPRRRR